MWSLGMILYKLVFFRYASPPLLPVRVPRIQADAFVDYRGRSVSRRRIGGWIVEVYRLSLRRRYGRIKGAFLRVFIFIRPVRVRGARSSFLPPLLACVARRLACPADSFPVARLLPVAPLAFPSACATRSSPCLRPLTRPLPSLRRSLVPSPPLVPSPLLACPALALLAARLSHPRCLPVLPSPASPRPRSPVIFIAIPR